MFEKINKHSSEKKLKIRIYPSVDINRVIQKLQTFRENIVARIDFHYTYIGGKQILVAQSFV